MLKYEYVVEQLQYLVNHLQIDYRDEDINNLLEHYKNDINKARKYKYFEKEYINVIDQKSKKIKEDIDYLTVIINLFSTLINYYIDEVDIKNLKDDKILILYDLVLENLNFIFSKTTNFNDIESDVLIKNKSWISLYDIVNIANYNRINFQTTILKHKFYRILEKLIQAKKMNLFINYIQKNKKYFDDNKIFNLLYMNLSKDDIDKLTKKEIDFINEIIYKAKFVGLDSKNSDTPSILAQERIKIVSNLIILLEEIYLDTKENNYFTVNNKTLFLDENEVDDICYNLVVTMKKVFDCTTVEDVKNLCKLLNREDIIKTSANTSDSEESMVSMSKTIIMHQACAEFIVPKEHANEYEYKKILNQPNANIYESSNYFAVVSTGQYYIGNVIMIYFNSLLNKFVDNLRKDNLGYAYIESHSKLKNVIKETFDFLILAINWNHECIPYDEKIESFINNVIDKADKCDEMYVSELLSKSLVNQNNEDIDKNVINYFKKNGINNGYVHIADDQIDKCVEKLKNCLETKKIISTNEIIFGPLLSIDENITSGDYTGVAVCQIKLLERYLKEIIIHVAKKNNFNIKLVGKNIEVMSKSEPRNIRYFVEVDDTCDYCNLSDKDRNNSIAINCGQCITFIKNNLELFSNTSASKSIFAFADKVENSRLYREWVSTVRNQFMHVNPVNSIEEARFICNNTAYWLLKVIDELVAID